MSGSAGVQFKPIPRRPHGRNVYEAMRPVLGIELGPSRCVLVLVGLADDRGETRGETRILSHHVVEYKDIGTLWADLRRVRVAHRLPRRARVVLWPSAGDPGVICVDATGTGEGFSPDVWRLRDRLRPLVRAGFRIASAIAPAQAIAVLAAFEEPEGVVAGLAVDQQAGSMAVARAGTLLVSRELVWKLSAPGAGAALLDRYAFAAQVLPQLRRMIEAAREGHAARVEKIVLCGSAPALRALAAPMIEELDVEVETLDGAGGIPFDAEPDAAAAAQLAAGAAVAGGDVTVLQGIGRRPALTPARVMIGAAAAAVVIVLVLLFWPAPQASRIRRATTGIDRLKGTGHLPGHRSALRGESNERSAAGETSCARRSASA